MATGFRKYAGGLKCVRGVKILVRGSVSECGSTVSMRTTRCGWVSP